MSLVGRQIGRYRIVEQLGQGGMSVVYKGIDTALDREVAVKVLHPHLAGKAESRKRLEREAKAVARLRHPNILEVYDYANESASEAFIVTELIRGQTLREFISAEALQPPEIAVMVVHEIAGALAHAHEAGVLHRDLKPENVMVRNDGVLKLMDFGIAKLLDRDEKMTITGALVGSPAHMAPEIIEGEEAGAEADVFSLGTMLYLFAVGKLPFTAPNTTATLKRILDCQYEDPRLTVPTVSDELAEVIGTCLQRQPSQRYANAGKLRDALADLLAQVGLTRPHEELPQFFLDPKGYRRTVSARVVGSLLTRAEALVAERKTAKAMAALNQVMAHDPTNARAATLLDQMKASRQREARAQKRKRTLSLSAGALIVGLGGAIAVDRLTTPPDFAPPLRFEPWQVAMTNVAWPARPPTPVVEAPQVVPIEFPTSSPSLPTASLGTLGQVPDAGLKEVKAPNSRLTLPHPQVKASEVVDAVVVVRPFGFVQVDDGPRSSEALARHQLKLSPGRHRFVVTCELCDAQPRAVEWTVVAGDEVALIAPLKPSLVSFAGFPPEAKVRIGAEERTVLQSQREPFRVTTPPGGSMKMQHLVDYVVTVDGVELARARTWVEPGKPTLIEKGAPK
jgi:serine/threonine-protein kinase